jgi:hypothetical protein
VIVRLPDDGTDALPVIRHIILKDLKTSTYKLALLRMLARIAECSPGPNRPVNEEYVAVPLGLVAVFWLFQFKPVLQAGLPQTPANRGLDGLGFIRDACRRITHLRISIFESLLVSRDKMRCFCIKPLVTPFRT